MILGIGIDICSVARMAGEIRSPERGFLSAVFTAAELAAGEGDAPRALAARFAAKEAVVKALAGGGERGVFWRDIEIAGDERGARVALRGRLGEVATGLGVRRVHVALSGGRLYAAATAVVES